MPKGIVIAMRVLSITALGLLIIVLGNIMNPEVFDIWAVLELLGMIRDILSYVAFIISLGLLTGLISLIGLIFGSLDGQFITTLGYVIASKMVGRWFYLPPFSDTGIVPTIQDGLNQIVVIFTSMKDIWFTVILDLIFILLVVFSIRWIVSAEPKFGIYVIGTVNFLLFVPMFIIGFRDFLQYINVTIAARLGGSIGFIETVVTYINTTLLTPAILKPEFFVKFSEMAEGSIVQFLTSPIFLIAVISFVFLEFIFQLSYVDLVTKPSIDREERLSAQIRILRIEAERAVGNIKVIEEEARQKRIIKQQTAMKASEGENAPTEKRTGMGDELKSYITDTGQVQFSYIAELIERKKLEREQKAVLDTMKETRRLSYYLEKLFKQDPQAYSNLTAKTSAPSSKGLIVSTVVNLVFRIVLITALAWFCMHPKVVFQNLFMSPASIANSVELQTPEAILSIFFPFILIIPLISMIIRVTKQSKLKEMLRMEEIQRSGLTEEEFQELERKRTQVAQEEVAMARDADVAAAAQAKQATPTTPQQNQGNP